MVIVKSKAPENRDGYWADEETDERIIASKLDVIIRILLKIEAKLNEDGLDK